MNATVITGQRIILMRAFLCLQAIEMHIKFGGKLCLIRNATPSKLRSIASEYTGVQYARSAKGLARAGAELREWYGMAMKRNDLSGSEDRG